MNRRLTMEVRAGAVSADGQIRAQSVQFPRQLATLALRARAAESVRASLALYPRLYEAVISDVTDAGRLPIPQSGVGRRRITEVFTAALSFNSADVLSSLDHARRTSASSGAARWTPAQVDAAVFAVEQLTAANTAILTMLRQALTFGDLLTVQRVLPRWTGPDADWLLPGQQSTSGPDSSTGGLADLTHALDTQRRELAGMKLRLLRTALQFEQHNAAAQQQSVSAAVPEHENDTYDSPLGPEAAGGTSPSQDPAVLAVLDSLDCATFWASLTTGIRQADQDIFPEVRDDEVRPDGWRLSRWYAPSPGLTETFVRAALTRPHLQANGVPDLEFALDRTASFVGAVSGVLATYLPWTRRYGAGDDVNDRAEELLRRMRHANRQAQREAARRALAAPIPDTAELTFQKAAAQQYAAEDIISRLFAWAGRPDQVDTPFAGTPIRVIERWNRETFTDPNTNTEYTSTVLGKALAHAAIQHLLTPAIALRPARPVRREHAAHRARLAIAALRRARNGRPGLAPDTPGIVVFVPADHDMAGLLGLTDLVRGANPSAPDTNPPVRDQVLVQLAFGTRQLGWYLHGLLDGVPVIRHTATEPRIVVLDPGYGIDYSAKGDVSALANHLCALTLTCESEESAQRKCVPTPPAPDTDSENRGPVSDAIEERITRLMGEVQVEMELAIAFKLDQCVGVRVLDLTTE